MDEEDDVSPLAFSKTEYLLVSGAKASGPTYLVTICRMD